MNEANEYFKYFHAKRWLYLIQYKGEFYYCALNTTEKVNLGFKKIKFIAYERGAIGKCGFNGYIVNEGMYQFEREEVTNRIYTFDEISVILQ